MNQETSETGIFLIVFTAIAYILLKKFLFSMFLYAWKYPVMAFLFPLVYIPEFLTNNILFFWVDNVRGVSINILNILLQDHSSLLEYSMNGDFVSKVNAFISTLISPFLVPVFFYYTYKIIMFKDAKYKKKFSIDTLIEDQADLWPQIKPMVNVHPELIKDLDKGVWAMGQVPLYFAEKNKLIIKEENQSGDIRIKLNEERTTALFIKQFGRPYKSISDLDDNEKIVFAIFTSKANRNDKLSQKIIDEAGRSFSSEYKYSKKQLKTFRKNTMKLVDEAINKYQNSEVVKDAISQHFHVLTVLGRLLEMSRDDGVLATANFVWLKPENRRLWFFLNNMGRRSSWSEISGPWYHYNYEKAIKRKIPSPMIRGSVEALDLAFRECSTIYIPLKGYNRQLD